ncbi:type IX secretion system sortase PorU [Echinicola jeungdonensis]|uniref:Type IX secretion system sortase PorU n=1 Tax=Echinicola jeungdonensis TaxID=709343 RepID=A0ABV5J4U4_9BACT|nr:type IX secretion system sortase PorU [Echinicola jeungdonensis]MDN3667923.1 type IX secretion system sortase PorU [Echinicola jeungdonensis]
MKGKWNISYLFWALAGFFFLNETKAQTDFYKIPITDEGIYKISILEAQSFGASSLEDITLYGSPGILPQELNSMALKLREIPTLIQNNSLYVFLAGPHQVIPDEDGLSYQHHYYSDTLYYLIEVGKSRTKEIPQVSVQNGEEAGGKWLYQVGVHKKEENNLLSSGRKWYGDRIFSGQSSTLALPQTIPENAPLFFKANFMAQSTSQSQLYLRLGSTELVNMSISPIPQSTYGIKGREKSSSVIISSNNISENAPLNFQTETADPNGMAMVDYILQGRGFDSKLLPEGIYYSLEDIPFQVGIQSQQEIWDISDFYDPRRLNLQLGTALLQNSQKLAIFDPQNIPEIPPVIPADLSLKLLQNEPELIIIAAPELENQARRLAEHKISRGLPTLVTTPQMIYDAYSYGTQDVSALRNFLAYHYQQHQQLKNVLFFGKGTFDYKNISGGRPNLVPTYSSRNNLNPLTSYSSDDYFGILENGAGIWEESSEGDRPLNIGVGRIPAINVQEAKTAVDKIIRYESDAPLGNWKREVLFVADDGDQNIHLGHAESHSQFIQNQNPEIRVNKLYLDDYEQLEEGSSQSSPAAKSAFFQHIEEGTLFINYIGHGNESTLMAEEIFQVTDLEDWPSNEILPLFVTATCEFGRHDSPYSRSGAEELLFAQNKGAIALLTTGRPVFSSLNFALNQAFISAVFSKENGEYLSLGEIFKITKNNSLNGPYNRNFSLLGDPSLKLALPELSVQMEVPIDLDSKMQVDTLRALQKISIRGNIQDPLTQSNVSSFNGEYQITLLDKAGELTTLGDESQPISYDNPNILLHQGTGKVKNGQFEAQLIIPQNIDYKFGEGIIRLYAREESSQLEAFGAQSVIIGGSDSRPANDLEGPHIQLFAEDSLKKVEVIPSKQMRLLVHLQDSSGIQISPNNLGQNITLQINQGKTIILNDHYYSINDGFTRGRIDITLDDLREGNNIVQLTAFDNQGNSSTAQLEIRVEGSDQLSILDHMAFPNPAESDCHFWLEHNRPGETLICQLSIYSMEGREIFSTNKRFPKADRIVDGLAWFFLRNKTSFPAKGTYIYKLELMSETDNTSDLASGKIYIQ